MKLPSKVAVITGSSSHIGRCIALELARQGAKVVVNARTHRAAGEQIVQEITQRGGEAILVQADLSQPDEVKRLFAITLDWFDTVDVLINNAGMAKGVPFLESDKSHWLELFDHNFFTAVLCSIEAARIMQARGSGKIINTTSIRGLEHVGRPGIMAYSAAKAALINFTKTLAKELAPAIQVNAVAPGFVLTPNYDTIPPQQKDAWIERTLIKRWITPEEIVAPYLFLLSSEATTGEVVVVDGGFHLK
jgi:3-oxoacyl-[acyl-carrier protein] reductase